MKVTLFRRRITETKIRNALDALGTTADEIAQSLEENGITGYVGAASHCPIANYLKREFSGMFFVTGVLSDVFDKGKHVKVANPKPICDFVAAFDNHKYPELCAQD